MQPDSNNPNNFETVVDPAFLKHKNPPKKTGNKQLILHVDDDSRTTDLVRHILNEAGYEVLSVNSGFEALTEFRQRPFDFSMALLDLTMPFMDGEETFHRLREIRSDLLVILCTGFIQQERLSTLRSAGLAGFLRKPIAPNEIVDFVRSTLASARYASTSA